MKVAIMQPYFFPYLGYFALIKNSDLFILFDTPQFIRHGWIERNKILKPNGEALYIKVPLQKHPRNTNIREIKINNDLKWKEKIMAQLVPYKKSAPNYYSVIGLIKEIFEKNTNSIVELNYYALKETCAYLGISTPIKVWSEMGIDIKEVRAPDEWALNICIAVQADVYYNPPGGASFFSLEKFSNMGIELKFLEIESIPYEQFGNKFHPSLSVIDVMMFCEQEEILKNLSNNISFK